MSCCGDDVRMVPMPNPSIDHSYPRWQQMQADMDRYFNKCAQSPKAQRLRGAKANEYCARVAWMILRKSGRYNDYPAFRRRADHSPYAAENPRSEKARVLTAYRRAYFAPDQGTRAWRERLDRLTAKMNKLGISIQDRNNALWRGPVFENPIPSTDQPMSHAAKAALWIGSLSTIIGGGALLLSYLWPMPTERLAYKGIVFDVNRSGGTWTSTFSFQNQSFAINGTSRDDIIAKTHNQVDSLITGT